jgi:hypothetical protein
MSAEEPQRAQRRPVQPGRNGTLPGARRQPPEREQQPLNDAEIFGSTTTPNTSTRLGAALVVMPQTLLADEQNPLSGVPACVSPADQSVILESMESPPMSPARLARASSHAVMDVRRAEYNTNHQMSLNGRVPLAANDECDDAPDDVLVYVEQAQMSSSSSKCSEVDLETRRVAATRASRLGAKATPHA